MSNKHFTDCVLAKSPILVWIISLEDIRKVTSARCESSLSAILVIAIIDVPLDVYKRQVLLRNNNNYLLENCGALRAALRPYFLRSLTRASRVNNPAAFNTGL